MAILLPQARRNKPEDARHEGGCLHPDTGAVGRF